MLLGIALGVLLLMIQPVRAQDAPPTSNDPVRFDYEENDTGVIHRYGASDPEGKKIFWTLGGLDAADFTIEGGELRFKSPPDYENPKDRHGDTNNNDTLDAGEEPGSNNIYRVTVRFGAGGQDGTPGADDYDGDDLDSHDVTVTVLNENEAGMVSISPLQPQVGTLLTANVSDRDGVAVTGSWQWASGYSKSGPFTDIPALSTSQTYRPVLEDKGKYLQVTARYRDNVSGADIREVAGVSRYVVREDIVTTNDPPKFADQRTLGLAADTAADGTTTSTPLVYARLNTERFIPENSPAGTPVGAPVTAFDDATGLDVLTYSLSDTTDASGHANSFNIDPATGQITVSASARLNAEAGTGNPGDAATPYAVTVTAIDGDGDTRTIAVLIRVVGLNEPPRIGANATATPAVLAPREISHWELDRTNAPASTLDADLDTAAATTIEPANYTATDPDVVDAAATLMWSLKGPDATRMEEGKSVPTFVFVVDATVDPIVVDTKHTAETVTLAFASDPDATYRSDPSHTFTPGPDFEKPWDTNKDNVYEVTLVVTDSAGNTNEYDVTVKVINSTEDNKPGKVTILNRQPEVATRLTATHKDDDGGVRELKWQWYRSVSNTNTQRERCTDYNPHATGATNDFRYFIDTAPATIATTWQKIAGATSANYTPVTVYEADGTTIDAEASDNSRCLRVAVTYRDAIDRTHAGADNLDTDVDETLEGTFMGSEFPVKAIDEENDAPVFTDDGAATGNPVSSYSSEKAEKVLDGTTIRVLNATERMITEALAATDAATEEDDTDADILTYTLGGPDAKYFMITGTVDTGGTGAYTAADEGDLSFKSEDDVKLDYDAGKRTYTVTITATDPSGDSDSVTVTVNITDFNEMPAWEKGKAPAGPSHAENDKGVVATYVAKDPEGAGITYSLVTTAAGDIEEADFEDQAKFKINPLDGTLSFKSAPNYEKPGDASTPADNMYKVVVRATVVDNPALTTPHAIDREVTVMVTNVNEEPEFSETTDTLEISENPDDPESDPLVNRGVGKPAANLPAAPNLDVGIPVVAADDDSTGTFAIGGYADTTARDRIDGLTYTLSGADAGTFDIVPATGQILTKEKLNYEAKNSYSVTVMATDPQGASDSIDITINVTDVDEVPVTPNLVVSGPNSRTYEENGTAAVGEYQAVGTGSEMVRWIPLAGPDADYFELVGSGSSVELMFRDSPNYEMPRGMEMSATNTNTYMVTVKIEHTPSGQMAEQDVTVTVVDTTELGMLDGDDTVTYAENGTAAVDTYTVDGPMADSATWSLAGDDMAHFALDSDTGSSVMLGFVNPPNYEMPRGMAMSGTNTNTYMVKVKAMVGGEMDEQDVTVTVTDMDDPGMVTISPSQPQVDTMLTATLSDDDGGVMDVAWRWSKSMTMDGTYSNIVGATSSTYTPIEADGGYYLMATASYTDAYGSGKSAKATTASAVATADPLLTKYDTNRNGSIDRSEAIAALQRYLAGDAGVTRAEAIAVLQLYLGS